MLSRSIQRRFRVSTSRMGNGRPACRWTLEMNSDSNEIVRIRHWSFGRLSGHPGGQAGAGPMTCWMFDGVNPEMQGHRLWRSLSAHVKHLPASPRNRPIARRCPASRHTAAPAPLHPSEQVPVIPFRHGMATCKAGLVPRLSMNRPDRKHSTSMLDHRVPACPQAGPVAKNWRYPERLRPPQIHGWWVSQTESLTLPAYEIYHYRRVRSNKWAKLFANRQADQPWAPREVSDAALAHAGQA